MRLKKPCESALRGNSSSLRPQLAQIVLLPIAGKLNPPTFNKDLAMKRILFGTMILGILSMGFAGCGEKATVKEQRTVTTPGGTTTVTTQQEVKKTGDNPPAARP